MSRRIGCQRRADRDRPDDRHPHEPGGSAPAKAAEQRNRVDDDESLHAGRLLGRPRQPDGRAPVVAAQPHTVELEAIQQSVEEAHVPRERVVEVAALAAATEARQVDGDPATQRERRQPVERARPDGVQEDRRHRVVAGPPQEHGLVVELEKRFGDRQHGARTIAWR